MIDLQMEVGAGFNLRSAGTTTPVGCALRILQWLERIEAFAVVSMGRIYLSGVVGSPKCLGTVRYQCHVLALVTIASQCAGRRIFPDEEVTLHEYHSWTSTSNTTESLIPLAWCASTD